VEQQLLIALSVTIVLLVGFMISALRILRDVLEGFGITITDMRRLKMQEDYSDKYEIINLKNDLKETPGNIQDWYEPDE
tara:strand:- start:30 stop:266 length:237 start_codon:yes stop_codon:yes gene_type:complete